MKFIAIIPARYGSSRFPGKPLADLGGKPMIERVYERVASVLGRDNVCVATDDDRIASAVASFGGCAVMTSSAHRSGTDRVFEAYRKLGSDADVIINIQGDEPFIAFSQINAVKACFDDPTVEIASLARPFDAQAGTEALEDPNLVKVVMDLQQNALYFSRSVIPYVRGVDKEHWLEKTDFHTHVGVYAYKADVLARLTALAQSPLELSESLEQLRWLQNGYRIRMAITTEPTVGIDTPADLENAIRYLEQTCRQ